MRNMASKIYQIIKTTFLSQVEYLLKQKNENRFENSQFKKAKRMFFAIIIFKSRIFLIIDRNEWYLSVLLLPYPISVDQTLETAKSLKASFILSSCTSLAHNSQFLSPHFYEFEHSHSVLHAVIMEQGSVEIGCKNQ